MIVWQVTALTLTAVGGTAVVLTREPRRQVVVSGIFGLVLALLFFTVRAPDVALSQIVVGCIAVPVMALAALARLGDDEGARQ